MSKSTCSKQLSPDDIDMDSAIDDILGTPTVSPTTPQPLPTTPRAALPPGYLADGYLATTDKGKAYLRTDYASGYAQAIANRLAPMTVTDFNKLLRPLKKAKSRSLPFEARQTAVALLHTAALALVHKKKAPSLLLDFIAANIEAIKTDADWLNGFYPHCQAIAGFLSLNQ